MEINNEYMKMAIGLAKLGEGGVNSNPFVGAVVVKDGKVIGRGYHKYFGGPHAEVYALEEAGESASGADIYVTLEPCSHYGKTPPCSDKIIAAGIKRCIIANIDPNPLVAGNGINKLKNAGVEVFTGILEEEAASINEVFFKFITTGMPFVFMKSAITLDGKIATESGDSKWITNEKARETVHKLRNRYMGNMIGINTVINDNPQLTCRIDSGRDPYRIVIDPDLRTPIDSNIIVNNCDGKTLIIISKNKNNDEKKEEMSKYGVKFIEMPERNFKMTDVMKEIGRLKIDSVMVEGGSVVISNILKERLVDKGVIFVAPKILGDTSGMSFVKGFSADKMEKAMELKNPEFEIIGDNIAVWFEGVSYRD